MANRSFTRSFYTPHAMPTLIDCNFTVNSSDSAGLGLTGLKGPGVANVYMHTSATAAGPVNPAAGYIYVQLQDNYNKFFGFTHSVNPPVTGSAISISGSSVLTVGQPYQITSVGTSTQANWEAAGVPPGATAAVGQPLIAKITGGGTGTGQVKALTVSGIQTIEVIGNTNLNIAPIGFSSGANNQGSWIILQCLAATNSTTTTLIPTAPADGSLVQLSFYLSNSSVTVQGE